MAIITFSEWQSNSIKNKKFFAHRPQKGGSYNNAILILFNLSCRLSYYDAQKAAEIFRRKQHMPTTKA